MGIAQDLAAKALELRKSRSDLAGGFQGVLGFAQASAKARGLKGGDPTVNNDDAANAINRGVKMCKDTLEQSKGAVTELTERTARELAELMTLLPTQASEDEIRHAARAYIANHQPDPKKGMGQVIGYLNDSFGAALDKPLAARVAREELNTANA